MTPLQQQGLVQNIYTITGFYDLNRAYIVAPLVDWGQRSVTQAELSARLQRQLDGLPGVRVRIRSGNSLGVGGGDGSVQMAITGDNYTRIAEAAYAFAEAIERELPALRDVRVNYAATQPQLTLQVDRQRAAELGVPVDGLDTVLRALVDGTEVAELTVDDRSVPVMLESSAPRRHQAAGPAGAAGTCRRRPAGVAGAVRAFRRDRDSGRAAAPGPAPCRRD